MHLLFLFLFSLPVFATDEEFTLGKIDVVARRMEVGEIENGQVGSVVNRHEMQKYNRNNVGDALNLLSGVALSTNARNEKIISVRGFDSRQVPIFIDGIPVYVPFDGYVDFNRFSTSDLSSVQVAKGFNSVVYGANTLGGAINLISRKPTKPIEADLSIGGGSGNEQRLSTNVGSNQGKWYLQAGASEIKSDYFPLSSDFSKTSTENGGRRDNSYRKDQKLSAKIGLTPKSGDEYALSYYKQDGVKGQPPSTDPTKVRYWKWPYWNKQSLYFISQTQIGPTELIKTRLYHDEFDNQINTYKDSSYSTLATSGASSVTTGESIYHDRTNGGSISLESFRFEKHSLTFVTLYKSDEHREFDANNQKNTFFKDQLITLATEDSIKINEKTSITVGASHHELRPEHVYSKGNPYLVPHTQSANEIQSGIFIHQFYATVARKTRMPTLKDRYSQRLGTFIQNPALQAENSLNYEVGYKTQSWRNSRMESALFLNDISNKIQTVFNVQGNKSQVQNIDKVRVYGLEMGLKSLVIGQVEVGGNYTYTYIKNLHDNSTKITDIPRHKAILNATYTPLKPVAIIPFIEYNSSRWSSNTKEVPGFTTVNLKSAYTYSKSIVIEGGVSNIADRNYSLSAGFPSSGRMFFANANFEL
jgi:iron complex outermembrane receptor protein